jgi:hypothetical protein
MKTGLGAAAPFSFCAAGHMIAPNTKQEADKA